MSKKIDIKSNNNKKKDLYSLLKESYSKDMPPKKLGKSVPAAAPKKRGRHTNKIVDNIDDMDELTDIESSEEIDFRKKTKSKPKANQKPKAKAKSKAETESESTYESDGNESESESESEPESDKPARGQKQSSSSKKSAPKNGELISVVCKLNINPEKLNNLNKNKAPVPKSSRPGKKSSKNSDSESDDMFDDVQDSKKCMKCARNEKLIANLQQQIESVGGVNSSQPKLHIANISLICHKTGKKISLEKTSCKCFWDTDYFKSMPIPLVESYIGGTYHVRSEFFCSINCALAYNLYALRDSKVDLRKSLTIKLYREMLNVEPDSPLNNVAPSAPITILKDYGGSLTIEKYREKNCQCKEYVSFLPPLKSLPITVEERESASRLDGSAPKPILGANRRQPRKKNIMTTMNITDDY